MDDKYEYIHSFVDCKVATELGDFVNCSIVHNLEPEVVRILIKQEENIIKHCIFLIYYTIYRANSPKYSIRKLSAAREREESHYDKALYAYRKYRKKKDEQSKNFFSDQDFAELYRHFSTTNRKTLDTLSGQELSESMFFELSLLQKYKIFNIICEGRMQSSKKCSNACFEDEIFPQIDDIYNEISISFNECEMPNFRRSVEYFALESSNHFEKAYLIAKKLKDLKCKKDIRDREKMILSSITCFCDNEHKYVNSLIVGYEAILESYNFPDMNAKDIYFMVHFCCYMINKTVSDFMNKHDDCFIWPISSKIEELCETFFGKGQHIVTKSLDDIRTKDFRDFYNEVDGHKS